MAWPLAQLGELLDDARSGFASGREDPEGIFQVRMNNVSRAGTWDLSRRRRVPATPAQVSRYSLQSGDVLFNATNSPDLVGKTALLERPDEPMVFSNHFLRLRVSGERVVPAFMARWLQWQFERRVFQGMCRQWVNQATVSRESLLGMGMPLPPIEEQRRIADILDRADALRAKRRETLALLDDLTQSIFVDMFEREAFPSIEFGSLVRDMRNGLSPSTNGSAQGRVLTLSAVTQGAFDARASKDATFAHEPPSSSRVRSGDILFCRGNGNLRLVGAAVHPHVDRPDLVFPDTVIAAEYQPSLVDPTYVTVSWRQPRVRKQIESAARTTNGTFKINQQVLAAIRLPLPHIEQQRRFAMRVNNVNAQRGIVKQALASDDVLFASLQQRAFTGEL